MSPKRKGYHPRGDDADPSRYKLTLYVSGASPRSSQAVESIKSICERYLPGQYDLTVVDVYQQPEIARAENLVAAPTLVKSLPLPERRLIGDMSDESKVLAGLNIEVAPQ